ncbi:hypothetical protein M1116_03920 [Patescibacteria group bacterium]|nr:hypothetical protein [Patescibacteria group bacterium]
MIIILVNHLMKTSLGLLLVSAFLLSACSLPTTSTTPSSSNSPAPTAKPLAQSLKDLLASGVAQKCTWESNDNNEKTTGELLIQGKKFKESSKVTNAQGTQNVYAISDGTFLYSWSDNAPESGIKMKLPQDFDTSLTPAPTSSAPAGPSSSVDVNAKYDYHCSPATLSPADLALPSNVKFADPAELQKLFQTLPQGSDFSKYAPDQLPKQ